MNHVTWLARQTSQRDLVTALLRVWAITTRKTMTGMVMEATKPVLRMSRMNQMNVSLTHCQKSRVGERMIMCSKISLTTSE